ncbi:IclR family transcriptional regulator [Mangrovicoccus algicola]|uniref:IclR family transcriptional regulator n=1 Tax=Mangrovicoccus algicola TaxID=2771008 RepID=A0A8J7D175_9RHOB|nr:IclR family transcriptional regulator [Mangrovicoccus algicola]MBE3640438.1 IclR family transcriptional regulator [Mangrovicoccus algicola]
MTEIGDETSEAAKYRAPALSKGLDILELLSTVADGLTQAEIAKTLGRTSSEIFRMLMVLRERGYVEIDNDRYHLTTKMFVMAHRHPPVKRLAAYAGDPMQRLADRLNQSMHLGILHRGEMLVIAQVDCPDNNLTSVRLGAHVSIYETASGRVLAAWLDRPGLAALIDAAGRDAPKRAGFEADLPAVRRQGYCVSPSQTIAGVQNLAVPIFDFTGQPVASVTIPFIQRLSGTSIFPPEYCRDALVEMCRDISRRLGADMDQILGRDPATEPRQG